MADEEFHEIQLNGKQLVFLFMAGTVAAVVIFLCGLMVGRNLRVPRLEAAAATTEATIGDPTRPADQTVVPPPVDASERGKPVTLDETLTYSPRLEDPTPVDETLQPTDPTKKPAGKVASAVVTPTREKTASARTPAPVAKEAPLAHPEPPGNGWVVQVQVVKTRSEADAVARRLNGKGYPTFVTPRGSGYGVRVGKFDRKSDAEAAKAKLEKNEQFKPWLTH